MHEAGHATLAMILCPDSVNGISMIPAGESKARTRVFFQEEILKDTVSESKDNITIFLGGGAAENLFLDSRGTGCVDDYRKAYMIAHKLVTQLAVSGFESYRGQIDGPLFESDVKTQKIEEAITSIMNDCLNTASNLLTKNRKLVYAIYTRLSEQYSMTREEMLSLREKYLIKE